MAQVETDSTHTQSLGEDDQIVLLRPTYLADDRLVERQVWDMPPRGHRCAISVS